MSHRFLNAHDLALAADRLASADRYLAEVLQRHGPPPLWKRPVTLGTLVHILLEQQVSLDSERATFQRLKSACDGRVTSEKVAL